MVMEKLNIQCVADKSSEMATMNYNELQASAIIE